MLGARNVVRVALGLAIAADAICVPNLARAGIMDFALADAGTNRPYSQLSNAIPTLWKLLQPHAVTHDTTNPAPAASLYNPANTSEPGIGNPNHITLGHIVHIGKPSKSRRYIWGIFDRLAVVPAPRFLYFDAGSLSPAPISPNSHAGFTLDNFGHSGSAGGSGGVGGGSRTPFQPNTQPIPEPTTDFLLLAVGLAMYTLAHGRNSPAAHRRHADHCSAGVGPDMG